MIKIFGSKKLLLIYAYSCVFFVLGRYRVLYCRFKHNHLPTDKSISIISASYPVTVIAIGGPFRPKRTATSEMSRTKSDGDGIVTAIVVILVV